MQFPVLMFVRFLGKNRDGAGGGGGGGGGLYTQISSTMNHTSSTSLQFPLLTFAKISEGGNIVSVHSSCGGETIIS